MRKNLVTRLRRRGRVNPMAAHDRLPPRARAWVTQAALPWSAASVSKIWGRALRETGCEEAAIARLDAAEAKMLARDGVFPGVRSAGAGQGASRPATTGA